MRTIKIHSLSSIQICKAVLLTIVAMCILHPQGPYLFCNWKFVTFDLYPLLIPHTPFLAIDSLFHLQAKFLFFFFWFLLLSFYSSVQFSCSVVSNSVWPHELQHARPPSPSPTPELHPNPCLLSQWCHPTISSSVVPFSSCPQSFPASGSFPMSQPLASGGQSIGVSASTSVLPMNTQDWSPLGWTGWISLQSKGLSRVFSNTTFQKHQFFGAQLSL